MILLLDVSRNIQQEPQRLLENHRSPRDQSNRERPVVFEV